MTGGQASHRARDGRQDLPIIGERFLVAVRDALHHLHDPAYLEAHPLTAVLPADRGGPKSSRGRTLRRDLLEAVDFLNPAAQSGTIARHSLLLRLRFVDGLEVREVHDRLAISRTEFYREQRRALEAVASILRSRWGLEESVDSAADDESGIPVGTPPAAADVRPTTALVRPANNLPLQLTSFVGRDKELAEVRRLLGATRLLTLTGSGGCGKTRLSLQIAREVLGEYPDGVWLVELAGHADRALVPQAVAASLGLREEPGRPVEAMLVEYLRSRRTLLVLDNCEHLLEPCGELAERLLRECAGLRVLANSREALGVAGEVSWRVPSLGTPRPDEAWTIDSLTRYESIRLFAERAAALRPGYAIDDRNASAIARICWRLDGMPLAIELAAARVTILTVDQIAARLDDRFRLLTGGSRTALPRQRTLRAAIDWSYDPLSDREKKVFRRLAVFAGGCDLEAAESVCSGDGVDSADVLDTLAALRDKSLIVFADGYDEARYRLLETIRQYALDRLLESGEAEVTRERHLAWFVGLADRAAPQLGGHRQREWLDRLESDYENLRAALEWSLAGDSDRCLRLGASLWLFWRVRGYLAEGRRWLEAALAKATELTTARAEATLGLGIITADLGEYALANSRCRSSLADFEALGESRGIGRALRHVGATELFLGNVERGRQLLDQSLTMLSVAGDDRDVGWTLRYVGSSQSMPDDFGAGRAIVERSLSLLRRAGDKHAMAWVLQHLAATAIHEGRPDADALIREELAVAQEVGDRRAIGSAVGQLAAIAFRRGDLGRARALTEESRSLCWETGYAQGVAWALTAQALVSRADGDLDRARAAIGECLANMKPDRVTVSGGDALAVAGLLAADGGAYAESARLMAASSVNRERRWPTSRFGGWEIGEFETAMESARAALGPEMYLVSWNEGRAMTPEKAVEYGQSIYGAGTTGRAAQA